MSARLACNAPLTLSSPATVALTLVVETTRSAESALQRSSPPEHPLPVASLHADLLSLLTLLYSDSNKLSIALNPASPTHSAALTPAKDIAKRVGILASNAASFDPKAHGRTLTAEVRRLVQVILVAIRELAQAHLNLTQGGAKNGTGAAGEEYLVRTAAVHSLIQRAKSAGADGLSRSNLQAVKKVWDEHGETVEDSLLEFKEMAQEDGGEGSGSDAEDGWDEAGFDFGSIKMDAPQRKLAETLEGLYQRTVDLHTEVSKSLLSTPSRLPPDVSQDALDKLPDLASTLSTTADELASRIYSLVDADELHEVRDEYADALEGIATAVDSLWGEAKAKEGTDKGSRAWFGKQYSDLSKSIREVEWTHEDAKT